MINGANTGVKTKYEDGKNITLENNIIGKPGKDGNSGQNGINGNTPTNFTEADIIMMHKIVNTYDTDVFCMTLLPNGVKTDYTLLEQFNTVIRNVVNHYNVDVVDLYKDSRITTTNFLNYSNESNGLHPNETGMTAMM